MRIGILGAGHIGSTVGRLWMKAGHEICFGTRHPEDLIDRVATLANDGNGAPTARTGSPLDAATFGEVILLAIPLGVVPELSRTLGSALAGKVVLDATNPYPERDGDVARQALARGSSRWTAAQLPGARVVKAFNMQLYTALEAEAHKAERPGDGLAVALASDDADALQVAERLVRDAGFEPVIVGPLDRGRAFDPGTRHYGSGVHAAELRRDLQAAGSGPG
jgi:predicted dinucleotide-binding enzyme